MCMQPLWRDAAFLIGDAESVENMAVLPPMETFAPLCMDFLDALSQDLLRCPDIRKTPDIMTFAFWCRRHSMLEQQREHTSTVLRLGRGVVFHVAPSNVPLLFAYSLVASLLAGNANIVRLSSRTPVLNLPDLADPAGSADRICASMHRLLETDFVALRPYVACLRYEHNEPDRQGLTDRLSALCDVRMIWGGDETIRRIRTSPLKPRATELCFADRFSVCAIRSSAWLEAPDKDALTRRFYADAYLYDQNACTAPQLVLWLDESDEPTRQNAAREDFWQRLGTLVRREYPVRGIQSVAKREAFCLLAAQHPELRLLAEDNRLVRVETPKLFPELMAFRPGGGFFIEAQGNTLDALLPVATEACQTLTSYGVTKNEIETFMRTARPRGIDRAVSLGHSMDFSLFWDGHDLIAELSRFCNARSYVRRSAD